jgi:NADH dehydrogenase (ubiquinone) 1 beta subcomplex subunit 7
LILRRAYNWASSIMGGGHHAVSPGAMPKREQDIQAMHDAQVPVAYRDNCGHLLMSLNSCRRATYFNPMRCTHQRHIYEECEYIAWQQRVERKTKQEADAKKAAAAAASANN